MKKYLSLLYLVIPVLLTGLFTIAYVQHRAEAAAAALQLAERQRIEAEQARREQEELTRRLEEEARLVAEAKATALREREEAEERERVQRFEDLRARLQATQQDLERLTRTVTDLESRIATEKAARRETEDAAFALGVEVEQLRARKASLDLEVQRLNGSVMDRFETSWQFLTQMPPPPARK